MSENNETKTAMKLEEKITILEAKLAELEKRCNGLQGKDLNEAGIPENSRSKVVEGNGVEPSEEAGPKSRAKVLINNFNPASGERVDQDPIDLVPANHPVSDVSDVSQAFVLRKYLHNDADENYGEIRITDIFLWELLKSLLGHYPNHIFRGPPVPLRSPYEPLIFHWETLKNAAKKKGNDENDTQARQDLNLLLDTIASGSGDPRLDQYLRSLESTNEESIITFETLWTLFPPGTLIYGRPFQGQDQVFVVKSNIKPWPRIRGRRRDDVSWSLLCWVYDWDGKSFHRMCLRLEIEPFEGHKPVTWLPYYPLDFHPDRESIRNGLIERGKKYRKLCTAKEGSRMFTYKGQAIMGKKGILGVSSDSDNEDDSRSRMTIDLELRLLRGMRSSGTSSSPRPATSTWVDSTVMVDFESYFHYGPVVAQMGDLLPTGEFPDCECHECRQNTALMEICRTRFDMVEQQRHKWDDEQYILCPPRVLGYVLRDKEWAQLQVETVKQFQSENSDSWSSRLKLADGEETKNMLLDLVKSHGTSESKSGTVGLEVDDIVVRKGKGLVMLFYGPPGVGKTTTAETVAIAAQKPLFSISVADVGTKAKLVEANLSKIFALATSWQAVLLIDEADVFLESRGMGLAANTERNALVSVFLRVLEYYQGIMILTTNQIAQFDVAVQSRIHIAIRYTKLSIQQTLGIFLGFLGPLNEKGLVEDLEGIEEWLNEDVNKMGFDGRQIRNIVTSALGLVRAKGKSKVGKRELKSIVNNMRDYKEQFVIQYEKYKNEQKGMIG